MSFWTTSPRRDTCPISTTVWCTSPSFLKTREKYRMPRPQSTLTGKRVPVWESKKAKLKSEVVRQTSDLFISHPSLDLCHLKHSELAKHLQTYQRRVVLRETNVKDDSVYRAALTLHTWKQRIPKLLDMAGEANDAVSACAQVHMSEASSLLRLPEKECSEQWMILPPSQRPNQWESIDEPVVSFCAKLVRGSFGRGCCGKESW